MYPKTTAIMVVCLLLVGNSIIIFPTSNIIKKKIIMKNYSTHTDGNNVIVDTLFRRGNGSESNPYRISNVSLLQNISRDRHAHYILVCDINANSTRYWNDGIGFDPIGKFYGRFNGSLDGQGYNITGIFINRTDINLGLFGYMESNGLLSNINLVDANITGKNNLGGLVGNNLGRINGSSITGNVKGDYNVGGLVGKNLGIITNCSAAGSVEAYENVGGLVGRNYHGLIENSSASNNIYGKLSVGGLVGDCDNIVDNCSATGDVHGNKRVGGFVGNSWGDVKKCKSFGTVTGNQSFIGGLIGFQTSGTVKNCYAKSNVSGKGDFVGGLVGYTYSFTQVKNSFYCIDQSTINGKKHPTPYGILNPQFNDWISQDMVIYIDDYLNKIPGTVSYNVSSVSDLKCILPFALLDYNFRQLSNIDLSQEPGIHIPVFSGGEYDGNGFLISNLNLSFPDDSYTGLFGQLDNNAKISNVSLIDINVSGNNWVGGLVGISGNDCLISRCRVIGNVSGNTHIGGLVGTNEGKMENCYTIGSVGGNSFIGGLIGFNSGMVEDCYTATSVSGEFNTGGLAGDNDIGIFLNCFWDNETSGQTQSDGGIGKNTTQMMSRKTFIDSNWDFSTIWRIHDGLTYPFFHWEAPRRIILRITTIDLTTHEEDVPYGIDYEYEIAFNNDESILWNLDTNAKWLTLNETTGFLFGIPTNENVGRFWVNISVTADQREFDFKNFTLTVKNTSPFIMTKPRISTAEDELYYVNFSSDDDMQGTITWNLKTNSTWLYFNNDTGELYGTPTNDEVGQYLLSVLVNDGNGGKGWYNYSLTVYNINDPPIITTTPPMSAMDGEIYFVRFNATDDDPVADKLTWSIYTNAMWLEIDRHTGNLSGKLSEGIYWVNVTVSDGRGGKDHYDYTLIVKIKDSDNDGVPDEQDAFPYDPAASVDTDFDGMPDKWNPGMSEKNSTSQPPLVLDLTTDDEENPDDDGNKIFSEENMSIWLYILWIVVMIVTAFLVIAIYLGMKKKPEDDLEDDEFGRLPMNKKFDDR